MQKVNVQKIVDKWSKVKEASRGENTSVDTQGGQEPEGGIERKGSSELQGRDVKGASKVGRQSEKGKLSGTDGKHAGSRAGRKGKADTVASKSKSVGSVKQGGRKGKGKGDKS
jgi:hypothetical protein